MTELEKLSEKEMEIEVLSGFLEWLETHPDLAIGAWRRTYHYMGEEKTLAEPRLELACRSSQALIYEHLGIDPAQLERERRELLAKVRRQHGGEGL